MEERKSDIFSVKELVKVMETPKISEMTLRLSYNLEGEPEEVKEKEDTYTEFIRKGDIPEVTDNHFVDGGIFQGESEVILKHHAPHRLASHTSDYLEKMGIKQYEIRSLEVKYKPEQSL